MLDFHHDLGEGKHQELPLKVDRGNHEHEEHDHRKVGVHLVVHGVGVGETEQHSLKGDEATALERIALQRHREACDELDDDRPASHERASLREQDGVDDETGNDCPSEPLGGVPQEVRQERIDCGSEYRFRLRSLNLLFVTGHHFMSISFARHQAGDGLAELCLLLPCRTTPCTGFLTLGVRLPFVLRHVALSIMRLPPHMVEGNNPPTLSKAAPLTEGGRIGIE